VRFALILLFLVGCSTDNDCYSGRFEQRHFYGTTQVIMVGKVPLVISNPAHEADVFICEETELEHRVRSLRRTK